MKRPFIIGMTGGSGAGKTSFIKALKKEFGESEICFISQDDYYRPIEDQYVDAEGIENFDLPRSIDKQAFAKDIKKLIKGKIVKRREYLFNNDKASAKLLVFKPAPIILVEGIFIFHFKKINELIDLKMFIQAKENLKVIRRIKRDRVERNYPLDDVLYRYEYHVLPTFEKYIQPYIDDCHLVINNNESFKGGLEVMIGFLKTKLSKGK